MAVVFIHGLGASPTSFAHLALHVPGCILTSYRSHMPIRSAIEQVRRQLPQEENILVGHSLGGIIALHLAHQTPVSHVVTISSPLGGSKPARFLKWMMFGMPVFCDLTPESTVIRQLQTPPPCAVTSLTSTAGGMPTLFGEENDGTVTLSSQRALPYAAHRDICANHMEILLHPDTVNLVKSLTR